MIAAITLAGAAALSWPALDAWFDLGDARAQRAAALATSRNAPAGLRPLMPDGAVLRAADGMAARGAMSGAVMGRARAGGLLIERINPAQGTPRLAAITLTLSGPEAGVIALIDHLERQRPVMRLARWRIEAAGDGVVRLTAVLVAPWRA